MNKGDAGNINLSRQLKAFLSFLIFYNFEKAHFTIQF